MRVLALTCTLFATLTTFADTITKQDGNIVHGTITQCGEENCLIESDGIIRDEIARIDLAEPQRMPFIDASESDVLVTIGGDVHSGALRFLDGGHAAIGEAEIERSEVALILLRGSSIKDLIILRDGSERTGTLTQCSATECTLDGDKLPLEEIEWIGFQQEGKRPPRATANVILRDDSRESARVVAIDQTTVRAEDRELKRADIAWVRTGHR